jgi:hypothetical protein
MSEYLKNIVKVTLSKIRNAQLRSNLLRHFNKGLFKYQAISPESFIKKNLNRAVPGSPFNVQGCKGFSVIAHCGLFIASGNNHPLGERISVLNS